MDALCSYLPASILSFLLDHSQRVATTGDSPNLLPPCRQSYKTSVLFADVSGYTALCEAVASKGAAGDEYLARHLNSYFEQLVKILSGSGGDVFKFAGDALIVLWPPSDEDLTTLTRRAAQCGLEIKRGLQDVTLAPGITLSVKIGVGVGEISILHVGGVFGRMEYVATGAPLLQAFAAEHHCSQPDVICSPEAWALIHKHFEAEINDRHAFLHKCTGPLKKVSVFKTTTTGGGRNLKEDVLKNIGKYVPSAVLPFMNHHEEKWASELRRIAVLFVNLGLKEKHMHEIATNVNYIGVVHEVLRAVQTAVYKYEGSLNKFLMDDKGSTLIAVFGLPPLAHEDDSVRAVLAALKICTKLGDLGFKPAVGCSTGTAFCGVVGSRGRREYSVLGDTVNQSARLMQHATKQGGGVITDSATQHAAKHRLHFESRGRISVKGKAKPMAIWQPYSNLLTPFFIQQAENGAADAGGSHAPVPSTPTSSLKLVEDETLHLRRKSMNGVDPFNLVCVPSATSTASSPSSAASASTATADPSSPRSLTMHESSPPSGGTGDTIDVVGLVQSGALERGGTPLAQAIDTKPTGAQEHKKDRPEALIGKETIHTLPPSITSVLDPRMEEQFAAVKQRRESAHASISSEASRPALSHAHLSHYSKVGSFDNVSEGIAPDPSDFLSRIQALNPTASGNVGASGASPRSSLSLQPSPSPSSSSPLINHLWHKRVRGVRVILPDGVGSLVLSTMHLESIMQLKEELSVLLRKKSIMLAPSMNGFTHQDFFLQVADDEAWTEVQRQRMEEQAKGKTTANNATDGNAESNDAGSADAFPIEIDSPTRTLHVSIDDALGPLAELQRKRYDTCKRNNQLTAEEEQQLLPSSSSTVAMDAPLSTDSTPSRSPQTLAYPPLQEVDLVVLQLCRCVAEYTIDVLPRKQYDLLLHTMLQRLVAQGRGGTVVIEGDVGVGKSHLMMAALSASLQRVQLSSPSSEIVVYSSVANPFEMCKPFRAWRDIYWNAIDRFISKMTLEEEKHDDDSNPAAKESLSPSLLTVESVRSSSMQAALRRARRRAFVSAVLAIRCRMACEEFFSSPPSDSASAHTHADHDDSCLDLLALLNDVLQLDFDESERARTIDPKLRPKITLNLLVALMQAIVDEQTHAHNVATADAAHNDEQSSLASPARPTSPLPTPSSSSSSTVVILDDGVFLDSWSWKLLLSLSRSIRGPFLLMLATRPLNKTYQGAFTAGGAPTEYVELLNEVQTSFILMGERSDESILMIAREAYMDDTNIPTSTTNNTSTAAVGTVPPTSSPFASSSFLHGVGIGVSGAFPRSSPPNISTLPSGTMLLPIPPALSRLILTKSAGNPLVCLELVMSMKRSKLVQFVMEPTVVRQRSALGLSSGEEDDGDEAGRNEQGSDGDTDRTRHRPSATPRLLIAPQFHPHILHCNPKLPIPALLQNVLGCRIDRLSHVQKMLLKVGALFGPEFQFRLLQRVYPCNLEHPEEDLKREIEGLIRFGILKLSNSNSNSSATTPTNPTPPDGTSNGADANNRNSYSASTSLWSGHSPVRINSSSKFHFPGGFMREMFLARMLESQKSALHERVADARVEVFKKRSDQALKSIMPNSSPANGQPTMPTKQPFCASALYVSEYEPHTAAGVDAGTGKDDGMTGSPISTMDGSASPSVSFSSSPRPVDWKLRYCVLVEGFLFGWLSEESFDRHDAPICCWSLEENAATGEDRMDSSMPPPGTSGTGSTGAPGSGGNDDSGSDGGGHAWGFLLRTVVSLDRFTHVTAHSPDGNSGIFRLAALNEKDYEEWGVRLQQQVPERLALFDQSESGAAADGHGRTAAPSHASNSRPATAPNYTNSTGSVSSVAPSPAATGVEGRRASDGSSVSGGPFTPAKDRPSGSPSRTGRQSSLPLQLTPIHASPSVRAASRSAGASPPGSFSMPPGATTRPATATPRSTGASGAAGTPGGGGGESTPAGMASPSASDQLQNSPTSTSSSTQDLSTLANVDKDAIRLQFLAATENRLARPLLPPVLLSVRKHAEKVGGGKKRGSIFGSEWKERWVSLMEESILIHDKATPPAAAGSAQWTRPSQAFSLNLGAPQAAMANVCVGSAASQPSGTSHPSFDLVRKVYKLNVEVDVWHKAGIVCWNRRSVILGFRTLDEANTWCERISETIFKHHVAASRQHRNTKMYNMTWGGPGSVHQRAGTWGSFLHKGGATADGSNHAAGAGGTLRGRSIATRSSLAAMPGVPRPYPVFKAPPPRQRPRITPASATATSSSSGSSAGSGSGEYKQLRASQRQLASGGAASQPASASASATSAGPTSSPPTTPSSLAPPGLTRATTTPVQATQSDAKNGPSKNASGDGSSSQPTTPSTPARSIPQSDSQPKNGLTMPQSARHRSAPSAIEGDVVKNGTNEAQTNGASVVVPAVGVDSSKSLNPVVVATAGDGDGDGNLFEEEDRALDAVFFEALRSTSHRRTDSTTSNNTDDGTTKYVIANEDELKQLLDNLKQKVKHVRFQSLSSRLTSPSSTKSSSGDGVHPHSPPNFSRLVSVCDLDATTRNWLRLNYTKEDGAAVEEENDEAVEDKKMPPTEEKQSETKEMTKEAHVKAEKEKIAVADVSNTTESTATTSTSNGTSGVVVHVSNSASTSVSPPSGSSTSSPQPGNAHRGSAKRVSLTSTATLRFSTNQLLPIAAAPADASPAVAAMFPTPTLNLAIHPFGGDLSSWDWDIFAYAPTDSSALFPVVYRCFTAHVDLLAMYRIPLDVFAAWLHQVHAEYFENPFHNFHHAVDVLQSVFSMVTRMGARAVLTPLDTMGLFVAALCHDLRHPGLNNAFHVAARTPLALLYNDQSVLEHHHAASTFRMLEKVSLNIFANLTPIEYRTVRQRITQGILSTDMQIHFGLIEKFNTVIEELAKMEEAAVADGSFNRTSPTLSSSSSFLPVPHFSAIPDSSRSTIFNALLHACDISNPAKPWHLQRKWSDAVLAEFLHQGDMERQRGLPISPNCDRTNTDQSSLSIGFIDFIVAPIFVSLRNLLPEVRVCCNHIRDNRKKWAAIYIDQIRCGQGPLASKWNEEQRAAEIERATRRTETFLEILFPPDEMDEEQEQEQEEGQEQQQEHQHEPAQAAPCEEPTDHPADEAAIRSRAPSDGTQEDANGAVLAIDEASSDADPHTPHGGVLRKQRLSGSIGRVRVHSASGCGSRPTNETEHFVAMKRFSASAGTHRGSGSHIAAHSSSSSSPASTSSTPTPTLSRAQTVAVIPSSSSRPHSHSTHSSRSKPILPRPIADPRRNSMMLLQRFVSANSRQPSTPTSTTAPTTPLKHTASMRTLDNSAAKHQTKGKVQEAT